MALAAAMVAVVAFSDHYSEVAQVRDATQSRHDRLAERLRGSGLRRTDAPPDAQTLADVRRANAIIEQIVVPWEALFDAIEGADASGLGLLSLTPSARDRSLRLAGEARSMEELLAYVDRMAAQPALGQVHLQGYRTVVREGVPVLAFTLAATWR
ncbi:MAG: hypothetical protein ACKVOX_07275 [Rhizobacter sp.]